MVTYFSVFVWIVDDFLYLFYSDTNDSIRKLIFEKIDLTLKILYKSINLLNIEHSDLILLFEIKNAILLQNEDGWNIQNQLIQTISKSYVINIDLH